MRRMMMCVMVVVMLLVLAPMVMAGGVGLTAKIGTLGLGADLTVGMGDRANIRLGLNAFSFDMDVDDDEDTASGSGTSAEEINLELNLMTLAALVDWFPFGGSFRLTGGVMFNNNEVDLTAPNSSVELNNRDYSVTSLSGNVGFNSLAPYAGIGFGNAVDEDGHWTFAFDLGVMLQGDPDVTLTAVAADSSRQAQLDADIVKEIDDIDDDTEDISMYPVAMIGVGYRF